MLHTPLFGRPVPRSVPRADGKAPFTPSGYISLRRKAANLTIDRVAELLSGKESERAEIRALLRQLETPGVVARHLTTLDFFQAAFRFDPDVYQQLATEPADRHPRICRGCGCSEWDPCDHHRHGPCGWAGEEVCTRCTNGDWL